MRVKTEKSIRLPRPETTGPLDQILARRRSMREFEESELTDRELSQLAWSAQGVTEGGLRTVPSAGGLFALEIRLVLPNGVYRYRPANHSIRLERTGDLRPEVAEAALFQDWIAEAPLILLVTAVADRLRGRYGSRSERYALLEAGHAAQNILLEAQSLGLAGTPVGAFDDDRISELFNLERGENPIYLLPIGHPHSR